jgi:hypothetical protein
MSIIDDGSRSSLAIPELERRKFYDPDDGKTAYLRTISDYNAVVDDNNITNEALKANGSFIGSMTEILSYSIIYVTVYSDVAGSTDGLVIEQSSNGTKWYKQDKYTISAETSQSFSIKPALKYMRVTYTNGDTDQSVLEIYTLLKKQNALASSHRVQNAISGNDDARLVSAVIAGKDRYGDYHNLEMNSEFHALVNVPVDQHEVYEGDHYYHKNVIDFTGVTGETKYLIFTTADTTIIPHIKVNFYGNVDFDLKIYEATDVSVNGTEVATFNNNRRSENVPELKIYENPTITDIGTEIWFSRLGLNRATSGISLSSNYEIMAARNTIYAFEIVKNTDQTGFVDFDFWWYEHTSETPFIPDEPDYGKLFNGSTFNSSTF